MLEILTRITEGKGKMEDIDTIRGIAKGMQTGSLCALGQLTPGPVMAALQYFEPEFRAHILDKECPAGTCKDLVRARCINACPAGIDVPSLCLLDRPGPLCRGPGDPSGAKPLCPDLRPGLPCLLRGQMQAGGYR